MKTTSIITKSKKSLCVCVCGGGGVGCWCVCVFVSMYVRLCVSSCALRYRPETWHGVGDGPTRFEGIFSKRPHERSKVIQRSSCLRNALWQPNLIGRTPDQSVMRCWGQRSCRGQPRSNRRSNCLEMLYGYQIW